MATGAGDWPLDNDGKPMVLISVSAAEKWPHVQFGNLEIGPVSVTRFVEDREPAIRKGVDVSLALCEEIVGNERERIRKELKG